MVHKLKELGLNEYEIKAYTCLLRYGPLSGGEVSKRSGVPHGKVYLVLHSLASKGFVNVMDVKPKLFSAVSPKIAVESFVKQKVDDLTSLKDDVVGELSKIKKPLIEDKAAEKIQILAGRKCRYAINDHFFSSAQKEMRFMFTYEERPYSFVRLANDTVKRGVKVKFLATLMTDQGLKWMKEDVKNGIAVRYYPVDEIRLQIMDDKESQLIMFNPRDKRDKVTVYFQHGECAKFMKNYFDSLWKKAKVIK